MWPFRRRSASSGRQARPTGLTDLHCHVLFDLDDGAATPAESAAILKRHSALGYTRILATPHVNHHAFPTPTPSQVAERVARLQPVAAQLGITVKWAGEIMARDGYIAHMVDDAFPHCAGTFLLEFPLHPHTLSRVVEHLIFDLRAKDRNVLIAHAERYPDVRHNPEVVGRLVDRGAFIQINAASLSAAATAAHRDTAFQLLEAHWVHVVATDSHRAAAADVVDDGLNALWDWDRDAFTRTAIANPTAIFEGRPDDVT